MRGTLEVPSLHRMRKTSALLLAFALLGCTEGSPLPEDGAEQVDRLVEYFDKLAFEVAIGTKPAEITKFTAPLRVAFYSEDDNALQRYRTLAEQQMGHLAEIAGLPMTLVDLGERPNLTIGFLRRLYFHRFARSHLTSRIPRQNRLPNHARCFVFYLASDDKAGIIDRGIVGIASDNLEWLNRDCIIEELTHILGLAQDTCIIRPSTFCGRDDLDYLPWYDALNSPLLTKSSLDEVGMV